MAISWPSAAPANKTDGPFCRSSHHEHRRALQPALAQIRQRLVRTRERIARHLSLDARLRRNGQKLARVLSREIGDRDDLALLPQDTIRETRDVGHVDAAAHDPAAFLHRLER